jgi:hypothetical protein
MSSAGSRRWREDAELRDAASSYEGSGGGIGPVDHDEFEFRAGLWLYPGEAGWHFVTVPPGVADDIDGQVGERAGFGSIPVIVTVGTSTWKTSLFPDKKAASFVLPVKKAVRQQEGIEAGFELWVRLRIDLDRRPHAGS